MTRSKQLFVLANLIVLLTLTIFFIPKEAASEKIPKSGVKSVEARDRGADKTNLIFGTRMGLDTLANFDNSVEFALSIQSLITSFDTPNGSDDYAAARYCIPASVDTPFIVVSASFFNNDSATVWPRILLTTPNASDKPDLNSPIAEVTNFKGPRLDFADVPFGVIRNSFEDLFFVVCFPPGLSVVDEGVGPAVGGDGTFDLGLRGFTPGNLFSTDGVNFAETNTTAGAGNFDAINWAFQIVIEANSTQPDALEPNNDTASATPISYGETKEASIDPAGELDFFMFSGSAGDTVQADVTAFSIGSALDGILTLLNSTGDTLAVSDDEVGFFVFDPLLQALLPETGDYFLVMNSFDNAVLNDPVGGPEYFYKLHLDTFSPPLEPDDNPPLATAISPGDTVLAALDVTDDVDFFSFTGSAGQVASIKLILGGSNLNPVLTLFDTDGQTVLTFSISDSLEFGLPSTGTYSVAVVDLEDRGGADFFYGISVEIFGAFSTLTHSTSTVNFGLLNNGIYGDDTNSSGSGFSFNANPSALFTGGFVVATSGSQIAANLANLDQPEINFENVSGFLPFASGEQFDQITQCSFQETQQILAGNPIGIQVEQRSLSNSGDDFVLIDLKISNSSTNVISNLHIGQFADWDVGNFPMNRGGYDAALDLLYQFEQGGANDNNFYGIRALFGASGAALQSGNLTISDIFNFLSNFNNPGPQPVSTDADYRSYIGSGPITLNPGDSTHVGFAWLAGTDLNDLMANAVLAQTAWDNLAVSVQEPNLAVPTEFALEQNYPNPFNPSTKIKYSLAENVHVSLLIYNMLGQQIRVLVDEKQVTDFYEVEWNGRDDAGALLSSGVYFYQLKTGTQRSVVKKMLLLK